eukprot:COSAG02_NODE_241_length_27638_cov_13.101020_11_plen_1515_part_00
MADEGTNSADEQGCILVMDSAAGPENATHNGSAVGHPLGSLPSLVPAVDQPGGDSSSLTPTSSRTSSYEITSAGPRCDITSGGSGKLTKRPRFGSLGHSPLPEPGSFQRMTDGQAASRALEFSPQHTSATGSVADTAKFASRLKGLARRARSTSYHAGRRSSVVETLTYTRSAPAGIPGGFHFHMLTHVFLAPEATQGEHGQMEFVGDCALRTVIDWNAKHSAESKQAKFMRLQTDVRPFSELEPFEQELRVSILRDLVGLMRSSWQMTMPSIIFSVTGSATPVPLRPDALSSFQDAMIHAIENTNSWIVSGGTDSGVMKLMGDILAQNKAMHTAIGIAPWVVVNGRTELIDDTETRKGTGDNPFRYTGVYQEASEGPWEGAALNPNHSHYLLLDDGYVAPPDADGGTDRWGREVYFREELVDFVSFRYDAKPKLHNSLTKLTDKVRLNQSRNFAAEREADASSSGERSVPVIGIVFGGGPNTIETVEQFVCKGFPVIIFKGSGRAADLIAEWKPGTGLTAEAEQQRISTLRKYFLDQHYSGMLPNSREKELELRNLLSDRAETLDKIADYKDLHVFDLQGSTEKQDGELLLMVLRAVFQSEMVTPQIRLPLALQYNDMNSLRNVLKEQGVLKSSGHDELTIDARPLVLASYHDQAEAVQLMCGCGFDINSLDHLILLNFRQMSEMELLAGKRWETPRFHMPAEWRQMKLLEHKGHRGDATLVAAIEHEWNELSQSEQSRFLYKANQHVKWRQLRLLSGWSFCCVGYLPDQNAPTTLSESEWSIRIGQLFQQRRVEHKLVAPDLNYFEVELICHGDETKHVKGKVASAEVMKQLQERCTYLYRDMVKNPNDLESLKTGKSQTISAVDWDRYQWICIEDPGHGLVLLQQVIDDEVIQCLSRGGAALDAVDNPWEQSAVAETTGWTSASTPKRLFKASCKAFCPWISFDGVRLDGKLQHDGISATTDRFTCPLDPLLRLYWAIVTGRYNMAEILWAQGNIADQHGKGGDAIVACLLCSFVLRERNLPGCATAWDNKLCSILTYLGEHQVFNLSQRDTLTVLFDENLICANEAILERMTEDQKEWNTRRRAVLQLFGCSPTASFVTRLDLAMMTQNKAFMGHPATIAFLSRAWRSRRGNGRCFDTLFPSTSPQAKWASFTVGYVMFLACFIYVYLSGFPWASNMSRRPTTLEYVFWAWTFAYMITELKQYSSNFATFREYVEGSGNAVEICTAALFLVASVLRVAAIAFEWPEAYSAMFIVLTLNLFLCHWRLLKCFSAWPRVGQINIIVANMCQNDVLPFLPYLVLVTVCFETTAFIFSWSLEQPSYRSEHHFWLANFAISTLTDFRLERNMVTAKGGMDPGIGTYTPAAYNAPTNATAWNEPDVRVVILQELFNSSFWLMSSIVLVNLMIAMMSNTFARIVDQATEEWSFLFGGIVREYFFATALPVPLNLIEIAADCFYNCYRPKTTGDSALLVVATRDDTSPTWAQDLVWPRDGAERGIARAARHVVGAQRLL